MKDKHPRNIPLWFHVAIGVFAGMMLYRWSVFLLAVIAGEMRLLD